VKPPFVVFGLPRSRTYWLSHFLAYGGWTCGHEELRHVRSLDDVKAWLALPATGTVETAAAPWWRTLRALAPDARVVIVRRPVADVLASLLRLGIDFDGPVLTATLRRLDAKLDQIARRWPGALSVDFADLASEAPCARVFEHCLGLPHDPKWWATAAPLNLQCDMPALMRYMAAYAPQLAKVGAMIKQQTMVALRSRPVVEPTGVTIQAETFASLYAGAQHLFRDHLVSVGENPNKAAAKNIPLLQKMDDLGAMQVMTARSNGRVFGYLMTLIGPCWEDEERTTAVHTWFYTDKAIPGLGMKLQRAALARLRDRGIDELYMRAGPRGSGPKTSALYRRLGAMADGELYKLNISGAEPWVR
jgi:GNAT superfamily N-acetyltransferase